MNESSPNLISKAAARSAGLKRFFEGRACPNGHVAERFVANGGCVVCSYARVAAQPREAVRERRRKRRALNPMVQLEADRRWRERNPDKVRAYRARHGDAVAQWKRANKDRTAATYKRYAQSPKGRAAGTARTRKRQLARLQRTPWWADMDAIKAVYLEAATLTAQTGVPHHVDHIVPLQGSTVSGLHVAWNLQVLTRDENQRKFNFLRET